MQIYVNLWEYRRIAANRKAAEERQRYEQHYSIVAY